jgi:hypothetical protein
MYILYFLGKVTHGASEFSHKRGQLLSKYGDFSNKVIRALESVLKDRKGI